MFGLFKHKHDWNLLELRSGRTDIFGHLSLTELLYYYECKCGAYKINQGRSTIIGAYPNDEHYPVSINSDFHIRMQYLIDEHTPWANYNRFDVGDKVKCKDTKDVYTVEDYKISSEDGRVWYNLHADNGCAFLNENMLEEYND